MSEPSVTRLTIRWSKDTDLALRSHLGSQGMSKGALSQFIEDAVKWRLFTQTVTEVREGFAEVDAAALDLMINEAVTRVRQAKPRERPGCTKN